MLLKKKKKKAALDSLLETEHFWNGEAVILPNANETPTGNYVSLRRLWYENKIF